MLLSVIIVSYNVKYYLGQCLYSLAKALKDIESEVIVFDNHSKDDTVDYLSKLYPDVIFISSNHNLGFAKANNRAILQSKGDYVLLLNPDTIVAESTIKMVLSFIQGKPQAGAVGVRMKKSDGTDANESRRGIPTPLTAFYKFSGLCRLFPHNKHFGKYYMGWLPWDVTAEIDVVSGAFCMLRRKALKEVGLLDEGFFMYGEDIDLSYRLIKGGWHNYYVPYPILHYKGESTERSSFRYVHVFYEAMLIFFRKHFSHLGFLISLPIEIAIYGKALGSLVSTLLHIAKRSLGFVSREGQVNTLYSFYVKPENIKRGQVLAKRKGLWAEFHDANAQRKDMLPVSKDRERIYAVFDTTAYTFTEMLSTMEANSGRGILMATYYPSQDMIITDKEIIR